MGLLAAVNPRKDSKKSGGSYFTKLKRETVSNAQNVAVLAGVTVGASVAVSMATSLLVRKRLTGMEGASPADRASKAGNTALMVSGGAVAAGLLAMPLFPVIGMGVALVGAHGLTRQAVGKFDTSGRLASFDMEARAAEYRMDPFDPEADGLGVRVNNGARAMAADLNVGSDGAGQSSLISIGG